MDIHHAMMVHNKPDRLYEALTQQSDLEVWMGAPTLTKSEVGSTIEYGASENLYGRYQGNSNVSTSRRKEYHGE